MGTAACRGKGFQRRAVVSGERPVGAASCRQQSSHAKPGWCSPQVTQGQQVPGPPYLRIGGALHIWAFGLWCCFIKFALSYIVCDRFPAPSLLRS